MILRNAGFSGSPFGADSLLRKAQAFTFCKAGSFAIGSVHCHAGCNRHSFLAQSAARLAAAGSNPHRVKDGASLTRKSAPARRPERPYAWNPAPTDARRVCRYVCQKSLAKVLGMNEGVAAPSFFIRRTGFAGSRSGRNDRFRYHFPTVSHGLTGK